MKLKVAILCLHILFASFVMQVNAQNYQWFAA